MVTEQYIYTGLSAIILILIIVSIIIYRKYTFYSRKTQKIVDKINNKHKISYSKLNSEIKRLEYLIDRKSLEKQSNTVENVIPEIQKTTQDTTNVTTLNIEKKNLEHEKHEFRKKNKQLWEQSIAIHKEKERIEDLKKNIEQKHREVTDSIKYALRIQTALLPDNDMLDKFLPEYFILWKPRDIVSGDFYWVRQIEDKTIVIAADSTGHGVPGAFMSMLGISFLNEISTNISQLSAAILLEEMRTQIIKSLKQKEKKAETKDGMDMAVCIVDTKNNVLEYAGANNPLYVVRQNTFIEIKATRNPVGIYPKERKFENHIFETQKDDFVYIFSDGYQDQIGGEKNSKFKIGGFKKLLTESSIISNSMSDIKLIIENNLEEWQQDNSQIDDILIIGMKIK